VKVFLQSPHDRVLLEIPHNHIRVVARLSRSDEAARGRERETRDVVVVAAQKHLVVRVGEVVDDCNTVEYACKQDHLRKYI
jgi:hypothetical protein